MSTIGSGPKGPSKTLDPGAFRPLGGSKAKQADSSAKPATPTQTRIQDQFQKSGPSILGKLNSMGAAQLAKYLSFSNEDLAMLARTFYDQLKKHGEIDRKNRSKLFAKAILKKKGRIGSLLDDEAEENESEKEALEELYEQIAEALDAPVFAKLVDEITESVKRIK